MVTGVMQGGTDSPTTHKGHQPKCKGRQVHAKTIHHTEHCQKPKEHNGCYQQCASSEKKRSL